MFSSLTSSVSQGLRSLAPPAATSPSNTILTLSRRLREGTTLEDRRSSLLALKGLGRDWKDAVSTTSLGYLIELLKGTVTDGPGKDDASDVEFLKALLETLNVLSEVEDSKDKPVHKADVGFSNTDFFLSTPEPLHALLQQYLPSTNFYTKFFTLQLLGTLLSNRPVVFQQLLLLSPHSVPNLLAPLKDGREILRNEALLILLGLCRGEKSNGDIGKLVVFEGAFDHLFEIIHREGGLDGGLVVSDCLGIIEGLVKYQVVNQNFFRETSCIPNLPALMLFPSPGFLTQSWNEQKLVNGSMVISIARTLVTGAGQSKLANQKALLSSGTTRMLLELGVSSQAPPRLRAQALHTLADVIRFSPASQQHIHNLNILPPPSPSTSGKSSASSYLNIHHSTAQEYPSPRGSDSVDAESERPSIDDSQPVNAVTALVLLATDGREDEIPLEILRVRSGAVRALGSLLAGDEAGKIAVLTDDHASGAGKVLLDVLKSLPKVEERSATFGSHAILFGCLVFCHLIRGDEKLKKLAREIVDGEQIAEDDEDEERMTLVHGLMGNLMMAFREREETGDERLKREWDRVIVGFLTVLITWMWESDGTVGEWLKEESNLQILIQPITQASGVDLLVQALCAIALSTAYTFDRLTTGLTRAILQPMLNRAGAEQFSSLITRFREDPRFSKIGPGFLETFGERESGADSMDNEEEEMVGVWMDETFVDWIKPELSGLQRAILVDPDAVGSTAGGGGETTELISSLRGTVNELTKEREGLLQRLQESERERSEEHEMVKKEMERLSEEVVRLKQEVEAKEYEQTKVKEPLLRRIDELERDNTKLATDLATVQSAPIRGRTGTLSESGLKEKEKEVDTLKERNKELEEMLKEVEEMKKSRTGLEERIKELEVKVEEAKEKEKEEEDLLVLLEELSTKRKEDKKKMKEAGLEVSEDEDEEEE